MDRVLSFKGPFQPELSEGFATTLAQIPDLIEGTPMLADTMGRLFTEALQKGKTEGRKEGRQEGRDEGAAWMLTQLIEQRFGPIPDWARNHIQSAGPEQLMRWGQLILTAPSLEALFEPGDPSH